MTEKAFDPPQQDEVERQILIESLALLYRSMPTAALGHAVAASFITYALYGAITSAILFAWMGCVVVVATARVGVTAFVEQRIARAPFASIQRWSNLLATLTFIQTSIWGASVFVIWPDDIALRALLITILAGIVATGGDPESAVNPDFTIIRVLAALDETQQRGFSGTVSASERQFLTWLNHEIRVVENLVSAKGQTQLSQSDGRHGLATNTKREEK